MAPQIPAASLAVDLDHFYRERMDPEFLLPEALYKVYYSNPESEFHLKGVEFVLRGEVVEKVALDNDELTTIEKLEEWLEKVFMLHLQQCIRILTEICLTYVTACSKCW
jgi:hypothetical protein